MAKINFSPDAIADLKQTRKYITEELCSEQAATNTISKIMKHIRMLEDFPESGALLSTVVNIANDYRFLVCGNYIAFYRYEHDVVYVVRVLYGRRDYMRMLFGEVPDELN
ncbi:MAG: type II toxin-antitoxin system RelE/ParE family toxin [Clostridia bacterium]|nr:type II toxin-antitoxin system RelE/ParE family toxin [Clostridia bacterium]